MTEEGLRAAKASLEQGEGFEVTLEDLDEAIRAWMRAESFGIEASEDGESARVVSPWRARD